MTLLNANGNTANNAICKNPGMPIIGTRSGAIRGIVETVVGPGDELVNVLDDEFGCVRKR